MVGIVREPEGKPAVSSELLAEPGLGECLLCYVYRLLADPRV